MIERTIVVCFCAVIASCNADVVRGEEDFQPKFLRTSPDSVFNDTSILPIYWNNNSKTFSLSERCHVSPVDSRMQHYVNDLLDRQSKLIEYTFTVKDDPGNPLTENNLWTYKTNQWSRVGSSHGQTILNLAFNYGVLSLMTLTFGVETLHIDLEENPKGCLRNMTEGDKVNTILDIVMRDMKPTGPMKVIEGESAVCHQVIKKTSGHAKFTDRCCFRRLESQEVECFIGIPNKWLNVLDYLLASLILAVFVFGPGFVPDWLYSASLETQKYIVTLKEPLYKTLCICRRESSQDILARHVVDLRNKRDFGECRRIVSELPSDVIIPIKLSRFDIKVNYRKLLTEYKVPVGMFECISKALFLCKLRDLDPFRDCCDASYLGCCQTGKHRRPWISICNVVGRMLLVVCLPIPFYIRLLIYYQFESPEIQERLSAASNLQLPLLYNYRLMQYLTPLHPVFLGAYVIYFAAGMTIAYFGGRETRTRFQDAIIDSFNDLNHMSFLKALGMLVRNLIWPFRKYGFFGVFVGLFFWPIFIPMSMVVCFIYCLPIIFLTCRILFHMFGSSKKNAEFSQTITAFDAEHIFKRIGLGSKRRGSKIGCYFTINCRRTFVSGLVTSVALLTIYAVMLMVAEVMGLLAEILCFTMMGLIVNASKVLKYGSLIFLVIIYSYDTYNNVNKKYLKLNKDLFSEIKKRIKDLEEHTSLPEHLQTNRGFKSCEASEQADYESTDDMSQELECHWDINDLILFVDSDDNPRIPRKLFDDTCAINVAGSPGPVYRSLIHATGQFLIIILFLIFIFFVVMSFGDVYKISSTNQTLATLAGGFMPFIFSNLLKPAAPQVETGLVSFRSKLEEVIKNFCQPWMMHDFVFDLEEPKLSDSEDSDTDMASMSEANGSMKKDSNKKDKHETKKDKSGDKKGDKKDMLGKSDKGNTGPRKVDVSNPLVDSKDIKHIVEGLDLQPAEGRPVDIVVMVSERDCEWLMEWSSISGLDDTEMESYRGHNSVANSVVVRASDRSWKRDAYNRSTVLL